MNYNPYQNRRSDNIDPNYIYPQPYIDPLMYMNPYAMSSDPSVNYNAANQVDYSTYSNPYAENPQLYSKNGNDDLNDTYYSNNQMNNNINNQPGIPVMPPSAAFPNMMPYMNMMPNNMMYPNMMFPTMMYPGMMPYMNMMPNNMVYPSIPTVNMEEFDEEEM